MTKKKQKEEKETRYIAFRVPIAEHHKIKKVAASYGLTVPAYTAKCVLYLSNIEYSKLKDFDTEIKNIFPKD